MCANLGNQDRFFLLFTFGWSDVYFFCTSGDFFLNI